MNLAQQTVRWIRSIAIRSLGVLLFITLTSHAVFAVDDVMLQTLAGKIVTGIVDDGTEEGTLEPPTRVFRGQFFSSFISSNPGFFALATGDLSMPDEPAGAAGFPSEHIVNFDLLPMTIGSISSNLFYWNGTDLNGDGFDSSDVQFSIPTGISWKVRDANSVQYLVTGTDQMVPGGLIQKSREDIDPFDGVDTGTVHNHLPLELIDNDGNLSTTPPQGIYMIAWQVRSVGFETSEPFVFVHRTSSTSLNAARDFAASWVEDNIEAMFEPAILAGDYNNDGKVSAADFTVWRDNLGAFMLANRDPNATGPVDEDDFQLWKDNYGNGGAGTGLATGNVLPEPTAILLLGIVVGVCCGAKKCRRSRHTPTEINH